MLNEAYELVVSRQEHYAIDEANFASLYPEEDIRRNKEYVAQKQAEWAEIDSRKRHKREDKRRATVLEYIIFDQGESNNWLGENALTIKTSPYDDIVNGVDMVAEFEETPEDKNLEANFSHLGLAIDITFGEDLKQKFDDIRGEIDSGLLSEVKYFESSRSGQRKLSQMPRVVISCSRETVHELMEKWLKKDNEFLASHPFQLQMLEEVAGQLKMFEMYAREVAEREDIGDIYAEVLVVVERLRKQKSQTLPRNARLSFDSGYNNLIAGLQEFARKLKGIGK